MGTLALGLRELAKRDSRYAIPTEKSQVTGWRRFGPPVQGWPGGTVVPGGTGIAASPNTNHPLTISQVDIAKVHTTVAVPLGEVGLSPARNTHFDRLAADTVARDPDVAWAIYRQSLEQAERAGGVDDHAAGSLAQHPAQLVQRPGPEACCGAWQAPARHRGHPVRGR